MIFGVKSHKEIIRFYFCLLIQIQTHFFVAFGWSAALLFRCELSHQHRNNILILAARYKIIETLGLFAIHLAEGLTKSTNQKVSFGKYNRHSVMCSVAMNTFCYACLP